MKSTKLLYLTDSYLRESTATIVNITENGAKTLLALDQTIFYPVGGGQPCDYGEIRSDTASMQITSVRFQEGIVVHQGKIEGKFEIGQKVELKLDWSRRYYHMQLHTAGHMLNEAVGEIVPEFQGIDGQHGINSQAYIEFNGFIDSAITEKIQSWLQTLSSSQELITAEMVTKEDILNKNINLPFTLPKNKPLRLVKFGDRLPVPDGGTQLQSVKELWPISLGEFEYVDNHTRIHYQVIKPQEDEAKTAVSNTDQIGLESFSQKIEELFKEAKTERDNPEYELMYLGKKGKFNELAKDIKSLPVSEKAKAGQMLNKLKSDLLNLVKKKSEDSPTAKWLDITEPGIMPPLGHLHPITQAIERITKIFESIGFTRVRYPEVDWDTYAFERLNMPKNHPARDEWETFFIETPSNQEQGKMILTPHTSNGQVHEMERVKEPPIRMLNIGKCYRRQQDVTHTAMFHQFEGLVIDKDINIQHLKGVLEYFAREFYGPLAKSRIRPFHFQFTEPSFEVDFSCVHCQGKGCRFCKSGWHEVGGAGMVHPNVLLASGIDPNIFTGFAFGWGIERVYTLQPGLELDDIRPLYSNNLNFLSNF